MKIINKSKYETRSLRKILNWCLLRAGMKGKNLIVTVLETRRKYNRDFVSGHAWLGKGDFSRHTYITLKFPIRPNGLKPFHAARTMLHELAHVRGLSHKDMKIYLTEENVPADFTLVRKEPVRKKKTVDDKLALIRSRIKEKESRLKRVQTSLKKLRRREKYYFKRISNEKR